MPLRAYPAPREPAPLGPPDDSRLDRLLLAGGVVTSAVGLGYTYGEQVDQAEVTDITDATDNLDHFPQPQPSASDQLVVNLPHAHATLSGTSAELHDQLFYRRQAAVDHFHVAVGLSYLGTGLAALCYAALFHRLIKSLGGYGDMGGAALSLFRLHGSK